MILLIASFSLLFKVRVGEVRVYTAMCFLPAAFGPPLNEKAIPLFVINVSK
jgi:hypothetical protein